MYDTDFTSEDIVKESESSTITTHPGRIKEAVKTVVCDLENVLGELNSVVGDLHVLVNQIDEVTGKIDRRYGMEAHEKVPNKPCSLPLAQIEPEEGYQRNGMNYRRKSLVFTRQSQILCFHSDYMMLSRNVFPDLLTSDELTRNQGRRLNHKDDRFQDYNGHRSNYQSMDNCFLDYNDACNEGLREHNGYFDLESVGVFQTQNSDAEISHLDRLPLMKPSLSGQSSDTSGYVMSPKSPPESPDELMMTSQQRPCTLETHRFLRRARHFDIYSPNRMCSPESPMENSFCIPFPSPFPSLHTSSTFILQSPTSPQTPNLPELPGCPGHCMGPLTPGQPPSCSDYCGVYERELEEQLEADLDDDLDNDLLKERDVLDNQSSAEYEAAIRDRVDTWASYTVRDINVNSVGWLCDPMINSPTVDTVGWLSESHIRSPTMERQDIVNDNVCLTSKSYKQNHEWKGSMAVPNYITKRDDLRRQFKNSQ